MPVWKLGPAFSNQSQRAIWFCSVFPAKDTCLLRSIELKQPASAVLFSANQTTAWVTQLPAPSLSQIVNGDVSRNSASATNFFLRVRTELNEHKRVKRAFYGKLVGPIIVDVHDTKTAMLRFTYYLNPTSLDRNMEFDPKQNLFKNLSSMEQVNEP